MRDFGREVAEARHAMGLSQAELSERSAVPKRTIQDIEAGKVAKPQRMTRIRLQEALDIPGDVDDERAAYPEEVQTILDIVGAHLMNMTYQEQLAFLRDALALIPTRD